ncbi:NAD-dependent epimerase/dehydratase family protein [Pedobacter frigoris]|uniref:NAD-dependent epimerase/dehydratase family protein n=1 Tax=Pedobacter frigoris TaxID=2571272 RepID=UPI0029315D6F|nr:NAD-dependent epimerase/dehydratase family protein [Pedobacter frigoris]
MEIKLIITGATGMVGEGVLMECLQHPEVKQVLSVSRRPSRIKHPKLKECIVPDFFNLDKIEDKLIGYDACFYCAGITSRGLNEEEYSLITYKTTLFFAQKLVRLNPSMVFSHISGSHSDSSEKGKIMWARVKGKTENALMKLPFRQVYNFRPGFMKPSEGQKNIKTLYKMISSLYPLLRTIFPDSVSTMHQVGLAMINSVLKGYSKQILEVKDINSLSGI